MNKLIVILFLAFFSNVSLAQEHVEVPNVFTPNNDGVNDFFTIRTEGYTALKCKIFNRYGGMVYQFYGLNGWWDGYTHAGGINQQCPTGVYFVVLELTTQAGEVKTFQGDLHLFR